MIFTYLFYLNDHIYKSNKASSRIGAGNGPYILVRDTNVFWISPIISLSSLLSFSSMLMIGPHSKKPLVAVIKLKDIRIATIIPQRATLQMQTVCITYFGYLKNPFPPGQYTALQLDHKRCFIFDRQLCI